MFHRAPKLQIKTDEQIHLMRAAGLVVADALEAVVAAVQPGVTGKVLDAIAEEVIRSAGAVPSFLGYYGYPASICVSIDNAIVHGIPTDEPIPEGSLVSVDCGAILAGWHGDAAVTCAVGQVGRGATELSDTTRCALWHGLAHARPGGRLTDIGAVSSRSCGEPLTTTASCATTSGTASARRCIWPRTCPMSDRREKVRTWCRGWSSPSNP